MSAAQIQIPGCVTGTWDIDPLHTEVGFSVRHLMVSKVRGRFTRFEGSFVTAADPLQSSTTATIDMTSIDTNNPTRDNDLRSSNFFEVDQYPQMSYRSTGMRVDGEQFILDGELTAHGMTRPVPLQVEVNGFGADPYGNTRCGFTATGSLNRSDFAMTFNVALEAATSEITRWVEDYNTARPHQALDMACPAARFTTREIEPDLPLVLPAALNGLDAPAVLGQDLDEDTEPSTTSTPVPQRNTALAIEVERVVPPSGNLWLAGQQIWLGPVRAGQTVSLWADPSVVHVSYQGTRLKSLPSRLSTADLHALLARDARPAGPPPITTGTVHPGGPIEVDRLINATGVLALGGRQFPVGHQWAGHRVTVRLDGALMQVSSNGTLLRSLPNPFTTEQRTHIRDARPAGPPPRPAATPLRVERRVDHGGVLVIATQRIRVGRVHAGATLTVEVSDTVYRILDGAQLLTTATRTSGKEVARFKARKSQPALRSSRGH